ncbi:Hsp20 family protein [Aeromonas hydrophila]|jgi:molecular chaperone IbpA|uniref:16 kDa heat shock protein A n=1 Tax=Aeromonas hydrophila subsp. hydrophila (strain ATCC 7966 / DSM 30187 / BCRC 13018 / CCUG 14551 / JCM 1027 / KCTC 2358 / NCIMB 9240 / NCTC 8049) TaxID=380703 RepID=A0KEA7_AERHH|nr:Hsp20 family protein [Aeromonas hydrophila]HDT5892620.1 Hsp20 family protein [Aeromonas hydrophila subsp. hydrophila]ABK38558.1 16 kDa heat shock protein A [Aeromonas hydrophila subsp. hydrophila ATCC 7966]EGX6955539.1 Hsp20 family protein [Aeromonas hydrophila]EZH80741.1 heat shock protein IbpA [Aeromonas hydrophila AD9]KHE16962.1 heat shock protein IbpA [Aeromonas hydrophila]
MRNLDFSHLYSNAVGFERMARELEGLFEQKTAAYPPYNIEKRDQDGYRITVAVAGFEREELELETENGTLKVKGRKAATDERQFLHQGIAERDFELAFKLSQHVEVQGAKLEHGLLTIDLARELPEALKPRAIPIGKPEQLALPG